MATAQSKAIAEKIIDHLESRDKPGRGLNNAFGRVSRKEFPKIIEEVANIVEGKPAVAAEPAPEVKTKSAKPAQA